MAHVIGAVIVNFPSFLIGVSGVVDMAISRHDGSIFSDELLYALKYLPVLIDGTLHHQHGAVDVVE